MSLRAQHLTAAACGAALAVHACALTRVHGLLAGADPTSPGFAVAGGLLLGWGLAARSSRASSRTSCLLAAAAAGLLGFAAPIPLALSTGLPAALMTALMVALPAALVGRARPGLASPQLLIGGGVGALLASLVLLPQLGPTVAALIATCLLLGGALLMSPDAGAADPAAPSAETDARGLAGPGLAAEPLAAVLIAASLAAGLASALRPWPFGGMAAGCVALGLGAAALWRPSGRLRSLAAGLVALLLVPWIAELLPFSSGLLVESDSRPLVAPLWGGLALLLAALGWGFGPGLLAGLVAGRPKPGPTAVAGALVLFVGLVDLSSLATRPASLLALAALLVAGLLGSIFAPGLKELFSSPKGATLAAAASLLFLLAPIGERGGFGRGLRVVQGEQGSASLQAHGSAIAFSGLERRPDELLAGHVAGLMASERRSVLLVGLQSGGALSALRAQGFEEIAIREFAGDLARSGFVGGLERAPDIAAAPSAWPERKGGWDAFVLQADDPSLPLHAPAFTESAYRRAASLLAPGGVFVQRLRVSRLGPEGLIRVVRTVRLAFPDCFLLTADLARDGALLLVARSPRDGAVRLPWDRLLLDPELNPRFDEAVARSLREALLFKKGDLLNTFAAGPRELDQLFPEVESLNPWTPGSAALSFPAPEGAAVSLTRALLYARIATLELPVEFSSRRGQAPWLDRWPFAGLESRLGASWTAAGGVLRYGNRFRPVLGDFGLYRDLSAKIAFERPEGRIEVVELGRSVAGADTVAASARSFLDQHATRTVEAMINGHLALVVIREPRMEEQHVHMTWHCPVQGKLYAADYALHDAKPGLYEGPLEELGQSLRCSHASPTEEP